MCTVNKIKIAVFGINDIILQAIKNKIDPRKAEIVLFIDNDKIKQGTCYMNIPVVFPEKDLFEKYEIDYFLVTALSAFGLIRSQLMKMGVRKEQIQVFVTEDICNYCMGSIDDIDLDIIKRIYFQPDKIINAVAKYQHTYRKYLQISAYEYEGNEWFHKSRLISHACGGIVNGKKVIYSNSKEAFLYSMREGFELLECDVLRVSDHEWFLAHDFYHFYESEQYSILSLRELLLLLTQYSNVCCLLDVKWDEYEEYVSCVDEIERFIESVFEDNTKRNTFKKQIILEVYDEWTIRYAKEKGYEVIYTQYKNPDWRCFMNTASLCSKYGVKAIALSVYHCLHRKNVLKIFTDKNISIFAFSTDSKEDYAALRKAGVTGVFTNYLTHKDLHGETGMETE